MGTVTGVTQDAPRTRQTPPGPTLWSLARVGVLALAALAHLWRLGSAGWTNPYYTTVVDTGMSRGLHAVLAGEMDVNGFLTVDKPALPQLLSFLSAKVFGYDPAALLLPYALAGVVTAWLLMLTVRHLGSERLAIVAGFVFVTVPAVTTTLRTNQTEAFDLLGRMLVVYGAVRAVVAIGSSRPARRYWLVSFAGVAVAANAKMTMIVPLVVVVIGALALTPSLTARMKRRLVAGYTVVTAASLLVWPVWTDVMSGTRAFTGSSPDGTAVGVLVVQNFLQRLPLATDPGYYFEDPRYRSTSLWRLFGTTYIDEWAWWAPAVAVGLVLVAVSLWRHRLNITIPAPQGTPGELASFSTELRAPVQRFLAVVLLGWFVVYWLVLSFAASSVCCLHPYYLAPHAPVIAAFAAYGLERTTGWARYALVVASVGWSAYLFRGGADDVLVELLDGRGRSAGVVVTVVAIALVVLALATARRAGWLSFTALVAAASAFALLVTSMTVVPARPSAVDGDPRSGRGVISWHPWVDTFEEFELLPGLSVSGLGASPYSAEDVLPGIRRALATSTATWSGATLTSFNAAAFSVASGVPVMPYGGTKGYDEIVTLEKFQSQVVDGSITYGLVSWIDFCSTVGTQRYGLDDGHEPTRILYWLLRNGKTVGYDTAGGRDDARPTKVSAQAPRWQPLVLRLDPESAARDRADGNAWLDGPMTPVPFLGSC